MSASTGNTATLSGAAAMIAVAPVPDIGFILQAVGVGALVGTAVVLQLEWRQRRRGFETNTDLRWAIVARWTVLFAAVAIVVDMAARIFGGRDGREDARAGHRCRRTDRDADWSHAAAPR